MTFGFQKRAKACSPSLPGAVSRAFSALKVFGCQTQGGSLPTLRSGGLCPGPAFASLGRGRLV